MAYVPKCLSAANMPKLTTPLFIKGETPYLPNRRSYRLSEVLKMFRMAMFRGVIKECEDSNSIFYEITG